MAFLKHTDQDRVLPTDVFSVISHASKRPTEEQKDPFKLCIITTICINASDRGMTTFANNRVCKYN